jgi:transposase InsO family protein
VTRPDALWLTDFTYLRCWEGVVFFIDVFSRRIIGWQLSHMRTNLVLDALRMALTRRHTGADVALISPPGRQLAAWTQPVLEQCP